MIRTMNEPMSYESQDLWLWADYGTVI